MDPASVKPRNPKDLASTCKVPAALLPPAFMLEVSQALRRGSIDYGIANWRHEPVRTSVYYNAILRHFIRMSSGETEDSKSGVPHAAAIAANCAILIDAAAHGSLIEDAPYASVDSALWVDKLFDAYEDMNRGAPV